MSISARAISPSCRRVRSVCRSEARSARSDFSCTASSWAATASSSARRSLARTSQIDSLSCDLAGAVCSAACCRARSRSPGRRSRKSRDTRRATPTSSGGFDVFAEQLHRGIGALGGVRSAAAIAATSARSSASCGLSASAAASHCARSQPSAAAGRPGNDRGAAPRTDRVLRGCSGAGGGALAQAASAVATSGPRAPCAPGVCCPEPRLLPRAAPPPCDAI